MLTTGRSKSAFSTELFTLPSTHTFIYTGQSVPCLYTSAVINIVREINTSKAGAGSAQKRQFRFTPLVTRGAKQRPVQDAMLSVANMSRQIVF